MMLRPRLEQYIKEYLPPLQLIGYFEIDWNIQYNLNVSLIQYVLFWKISKRVIVGCWH